MVFISVRDRNLKALTLFGITMVFLLGYGVASYQAQVYQLEDEINDYHREILIASRLLTEYAEGCEKNKRDNFSPYVEHATVKYSLLLTKSEHFPYYMNADFIGEHQTSLYSFEDKIIETKDKILSCKPI